MKKSKDYINLLPPNEKKPTGKRNTLGLFAGVVVAVWLGILGWQTMQIMELRSQVGARSQKKAALEQQLRGIYSELGIALPPGVTPEKAWLIQSLVSERVLWSEVFKQFSLIVPKGLWFDSLEGNSTGKAEIKIRGGAFAYRTVSEFMLALEQSPYFEKPQLISAQKAVVQGRETVAFEIVSGVRKIEGAK